MTVGEKIRTIRLSKGMTLEKFGKEFNPHTNKSNVSRWEKNKAIPNPKRLKKIAALGNTTVDELLKSEYKTCEICRYDTIKNEFNYCPICGMRV